MKDDEKEEEGRKNERNSLCSYQDDQSRNKAPRHEHFPFFLHEEHVNSNPQPGKLVIRKYYNSLASDVA